MRITTTKGKSVTVKDSIIQKYMSDFALTKEDAIQMYLEDEGLEDNEDVELQIPKLEEKLESIETIMERLGPHPKYDM